MKPLHILLRVPKDDPAGLLKPGKCGSHPPWAWFDPRVGWTAGSLIEMTNREDLARRGGLALPLVLDGDVIPEAYDLIRRLLDITTDGKMDARFRAIQETISVARVTHAGKPFAWIRAHADAAEKHIPGGYVSEMTDG
jgi:hypothetical protein